MRSRTFFLTMFFMACFFVLPVAAHAGIPFFGPIIPGSDIPGNVNGVCPAGWGMIIVVINNIISFLITIAIVFVAPIMIAYAGFLYVLNPTSVGDISKAKSLLWSTVIGIVVALAGYLVVDAVMVVLYKPPTDSGWGAWSDLVTTGDSPWCLKQEGALPGDMPSVAQPGVTVVPPSAVPASGLAISTVGPGERQVAVSFAPTQSNTTLKAGYTAASKYSAQIADACKAVTIPNCTTVITALIAKESGGNPTIGCNSSGSCGIMQLTRTNGGTSCAPTNTACISSQITKGVQLFQRGYSAFPNIPNALAAYNSGITTTAGKSASGRNSAMVSSVNCPGYYAWQCPTNPGGLVETQNYVANICQNIVLHGGTCN